MVHFKEHYMRKVTAPAVALSLMLMMVPNSKSQSFSECDLILSNADFSTYGPCSIAGEVRAPNGTCMQLAQQQAYISMMKDRCAALQASPIFWLPPELQAAAKVPGSWWQLNGTTVLLSLGYTGFLALAAYCVNHPGCIQEYITYLGHCAVDATCE